MSILVKGLGLFNDAYQLFVMNIVNVILKKRYNTEYGDSEETKLSTAVFIGAVFGQLILGALADILGRRKMMIISCTLLIVGGILSASVYSTNFTVLLWLLIISRFILGFGNV